MDTAVDEVYAYETVPKSVILNARERMVRFLVRPLDRLRDEDPFVMIVRSTAHGAMLKSDGFKDPESGLDGTLLESNHESLLYFMDDVTQIYVHPRLGKTSNAAAQAVEVD